MVRSLANKLASLLVIAGLSACSHAVVTGPTRAVMEGLPASNNAILVTTSTAKVTVGTGGLCFQDNSCFQSAVNLTGGVVFGSSVTVSTGSVVLSSSIININLVAPLTATLSGSTTANFAVDPTSVTLQGNTSIPGSIISVSASSGVVFGSATGKLNTDNSTFNWDNTNKKLTITGKEEVTGTFSLDSLIGAGNTYIPFTTAGTGALAQYNFLVWDPVNDRIGLGTTLPAQPIDVRGTIRANSFAVNFDGVARTGNTTVGNTTSDGVALMDATNGNLIASLNSIFSNDHRILTIEKVDATTNTVTIQADNGAALNGGTKVLSTQWQTASYFYNFTVNSWSNISIGEGYNYNSAITMTGPPTQNVVPLTVNQKDTVNNPNGAVFTSTGTGTFQFNINGRPSGGEQNMVGGVTITGPAVTSAFSPALLTLVDSTPNNTNGAGLFEIWETTSTHNSYLLWIHGASQRNSDEPIRFDGPTYGIDEVNNSTDNAHGYGKAKVISSAYQSIDEQMYSSRSWDNTTFENMEYCHPFTATGGQSPGCYLNSQSLTFDSGVLSSSDTVAYGFGTLNGHTVGITGPLNTTASYEFALPSTFNNQGQVLYQSDNGRGNNYNARSWAFTSGGNTGNILSFNSGSAPTWTYTPLTELSINANYTTVSSNTVILASATPSGITVSLLGASSVPGSWLTISKVDKSSQPVTITANGTDTIGGSTTTFTLSAFGQTVELKSDGISNWVAPLSDVTPDVIGDRYLSDSSLSVGTASTTFLQSMVVTSHVCVKGIRIQVQVQSGFIDLGVYNSVGTLLGHTGAIACPSGTATSNFASVINLPPGLYYLALLADNTTAQFGRASQGNIVGSISYTGASNALAGSLTISSGSPNNSRFSMVGILNGGVTQ